MPPGTPRSRSFMRLTMRVSLPHLGQAVDFVVSMTFFRSAVLAIFGIQLLLTGMCRRSPIRETAGLPGDWGVLGESSFGERTSPAGRTRAEVMHCTRQ